MRHEKFVLVDGQPMVEPDLMRWAKWFEAIENRRVAETRLGGVRISTVFLGIDHNFFDEGEPLLFETMIFGGKHDQHQNRYVTRAEALVGHTLAVELALGSLSWWGHLRFLGHRIVLWLLGERG